MASASAAGCFSSTSRPVVSCWTSSGIPETRVLTTGQPVAMASISATGMPSRLPSGATSEGSTNRAASPIHRRTTSCGCAPQNSILSATPRVCASARNDASSGPEPSRRHWKSTPRACSNESASTSVAKPLIGSSRPTVRICSGKRPSGCQGFARRSTPQWITCSLSRACAVSRSLSHSTLKREMVMATAASWILRAISCRSMKMSCAWQVKPNGTPRTRDSVQAAVDG